MRALTILLKLLHFGFYAFFYLQKVLIEKARSLVRFTFSLIAFFNVWPVNQNE